MARKKTEADLEARMHAVLKLAFPWLPPGAFEHQRHFSVKLNRATVSVDGRSTDRITGRADILISQNGKPLALLELKREGMSLTDDDVNQGLSYARLTVPMAPFVIVSNGVDTRIHVTYSGEQWTPTEHTEQELQQRLVNVGKLAAVDLKDAVNTLMGSDHRYWTSAIKSVSALLIEDRTGSWAEPVAPFVHSFLIRRHATAQVAAALNRGARVVVVHGPPLSGKSNVLRELIDATQRADSVAVLMIEPSETGVFAALSHLLSSELGWSISSDDTREWLRSISNGKGATLVIALDSIDPALSAVLADLNELASSRFGPALRMVVAVDDSALDGITKKRSGREGNAFGRIADEIPLTPLDDIEFRYAQGMLATLRIHVTHGGESVLSLREPWILRALVPGDIMQFPQDKAHLVVRLPPLVDVEVLHRAAAFISVNTDTQSSLRLAASAILDQYLESRNMEVILQGISTFAVDKRRLEETVGDPGIHDLRQRGFLKSGINWAEQPVWLVRVPTLIATHIATVLADRMSHWGEPDDVAKRLIALAAKLPLGDVIIADALTQRISRGLGGNLLDLLSALLRRSPVTSSLSPGAKVAFVLSGRVVHATMIDSGKLAVSSGPKAIEIELETGNFADPMTDPGGWLILSHLAAVPLGVEIPGEPEPARLDEPLLLEVGQSSVILSRPDGGQDFKAVPVHDIAGHGSIVCHQAGIVEPITWALVKYFIRRGPDASAWIDEAITKESMPLLARISVALRQVAGLADTRGEWARTKLSDRVDPAFAAFPIHH
ncbi:MAG: type I restriction enzyme HsdR N-terminal domain-containing protein [Acidobacteria bacterium]|nr:type I restriction enzyme HsdR N-terminal domain-containing protein [Acidobacteriota bacterium]